MQSRDNFQEHFFLQNWSPYYFLISTFHCTYSFLPAKLHRIRADGQARAALHPQEPDAVQAVGVRHLSALRVHHLRHDPHQHPQVKSQNHLMTAFKIP